MFSLIRQMFQKVLLFDVLHKRVEKIEAKLKRFEKLADENEALWHFLDEEGNDPAVWSGSAEELEDELTDSIVRNMKTCGDA